MPKIVQNFVRIKTSISDQKILKDKGFTPVFSSNVSAIQRDDDDLFIRFHNGSIYKYPNQGKNFGDLLLSSSKGKWVWANLRRKNVSFSKVGSMPLAGDIDLTDDQLFDELVKRKIPIPRIAPLLSTLVSSEALLTTMISSQVIFKQGIVRIVPMQ